MGFCFAFIFSHVLFLLWFLIDMTFSYLPWSLFHYFQHKESPLECPMDFSSLIALNQVPQTSPYQQYWQLYAFMTHPDIWSHP